MLKIDSVVLETPDRRVLYEVLPEYRLARTVDGDRPPELMLCGNTQCIANDTVARVRLWHHLFGDIIAFQFFRAGIPFDGRRGRVLDDSLVELTIEVVLHLLLNSAAASAVAAATAKPDQFGFVVESLKWRGACAVERPSLEEPLSITLSRYCHRVVPMDSPSMLDALRLLLTWDQEARRSPT